MVRRNESWSAEFWGAEFWGAAGCCARAGATRSQKTKTKLLSRTIYMKGDIVFLPLGRRAIVCKRPPRVRGETTTARGRLPPRVHNLCLSFYQSLQFRVAIFRNETK